MFHDYPDIVNVDQVCKMLQLGRSSVYALLQEKRISHVRKGRKYIIPKTALIGFISQPCYNEGHKKDGGLTLVKEGDYFNDREPKN